MIFPVVSECDLGMGSMEDWIGLGLDWTRVNNGDLGCTKCTRADCDCVCVRSECKAIRVGHVSVKIRHMLAKSFQ